MNIVPPSMSKIQFDITKILEFSHPGILCCDHSKFSFNVRQLETINERGSCILLEKMTLTSSH